MNESEARTKTKAKVFLRRDVYLLNRCALLGRRYSLLLGDIPFTVPIIYNPPFIRVREIFSSPYIVPLPLRDWSLVVIKDALSRKKISGKRSKIER